MVRPMPIIHANIREGFSPVIIGIGLFVSVSFLVSLCAKHAKQFSRKSGHPNTAKQFPSPKKLIAAISQKAMTVNGGKKTMSDGGAGPGDGGAGPGDGESGVWQKAILMGEKCQPPEFSGVIYYDYSGNRVPEMPKSPRVGPLSPLRSFNPIIENSMY